MGNACIHVNVAVFPKPQTCIKAHRMGLRPKRHQPHAIPNPEPLHGRPDQSRPDAVTPRLWQHTHPADLANATHCAQTGSPDCNAILQGQQMHGSIIQIVQLIRLRHALLFDEHHPAQQAA